MAASSSAGQIASDAAAVCSIADLPDELLIGCLSHLSLKTLQRVVALVSRRFAAAACSPELLREVEVWSLDTLPLLRSFLAWLLRHGHHVRRLSMDCDPEEEGEEEDEEEIAAAAIAACMPAVGAAGQLQQLELHAPGGTAWLAAMPSLRRLQLYSWQWDAPLTISPSISALTNLESLTAEGSNTEFADSVQLPPSITHLHLSISKTADLAQQMAQLPRLADLELESMDLPAASVAQLSRLAGSLTRLQLTCCSVPAALPALTRLQHLSVRDCSEADDRGGAIAAALPNLLQLTCLILEVEDLALPQGLAGLSRLQRCYLGELAAAALPAGPWLAGLRWLAADQDTLIASSAVLRAAPALELLEACSSEFDAETDCDPLEPELQPPATDWRSPAAAAFFDWLARHPPLRHACFRFRITRTAPLSQFFLEHLARLRRSRPGRQVQCTGRGLPAAEVSFLQLMGLE